MSWSDFHKQSEVLAADAHEASRLGNADRAKELFSAAAESEQRALQYVASDKPRTLGITAVSAVSLWYKAGKLEAAAELAHSASTIRNLPAFALNELRGLLQSIWNQQAQEEAGITFAPGQVIVSVKGGEVVAGGAPLDLIIDKVQIVQSLFYRTAEHLKSLPLRKKGPPSKDIQEGCRPWLFQSVPGSYQFSVAIQKPPQQEMFPTGGLEPQVLTETFLSILKAAGEDPGHSLNLLVTDVGYRETFLKLTRNLAPTGKLFHQMDIRGIGDRSPVVLLPESRRLISDTLRTARAKTIGEASDQESTIPGVLRALDLDKDWLEVSSSGVSTRVEGVRETVDDLIGSMVNREVIVRVRQRGRNKFDFIDIEQPE
jgi:hypothetical protein